MNNPHIIPVVLDINQNAKVMLEIHRQSCKLSLQYTATILKSLEVFRHFFLNPSHFRMLGDQVSDLFQLFLKSVFETFRLEAVPGPEVDQLHSILVAVLTILRNFTLQFLSKIPKATW
jgi:hypothetical protein